MMAVKRPLKIPACTALANVASNSLLSASWAIMRARIKLNVRAAIPSKSSSTPMAAFQSASTRVRRDVSESEGVRSWVAHSMARTITDGGDRRPPHPIRVQLSEIVVTEDLMAMLGQPLIKRALRHQMPAHHPSLQQRTLRINPAQHTPKSIPPATQSGGPSRLDFMPGHVDHDLSYRARQDRSDHRHAAQAGVPGQDLDHRRPPHSQRPQLTELADA